MNSQYSGNNGANNNYPNSTFAWYQATSNASMNAVGVNDKAITADAGSHKFAGDGLKFSSAFEAVTETYSGNTNRKTYDTDHFENVELTNDNGYTYYTSPSGKVVEASDTIGQTFGVAAVRFSFRTDEEIPAIPTANQIKDAYSQGTHDVSLFIRGTGHAKVLSGAEVPTKATTDSSSALDKDGFKALTIQVKLTITDQGAYSVQAKIGGGDFADVTEVTNAQSEKQAQWVVKFYYAISPEYAAAVGQTGQSTDSTTTHHSSDIILVSTTAE